MNTRATNTAFMRIRPEWKRRSLLAVCLLAAAAGCLTLLPHAWTDVARTRLQQTWLAWQNSPQHRVATIPHGDGHDDHDHAHHGASGTLQGNSHGSASHGHAPGTDQHQHDEHHEADSLQLSPQAQKNIGLRTQVISLQPYVRSITVPAIVIGRPGRSRVEVTAPLGGLLTRVYPIEGEAVEPGQPLFDLRLTHEELVQAQSELLRSTEQLDVELQEIRRLETVVESGAVPGKRLLERQYEKRKIEAVLNAQRQSLLLHGLTEEQIGRILEERKLVRDVLVSTPDHPRNGHDTGSSHPFTVRTLHVRPGQYVDAGTPLCSLMDYSQLYIEGRAFEHDAAELLKACREGWQIEARFDEQTKDPVEVAGLQIVYVDNEVEPESRALRFFVGLPNAILHESRSTDGHRFLTWRYRPGQRLQLQVPVETWPDRIVLPIDGVARESAEHYVFRQHGEHFDRVTVHVEYQDRSSAVVASDGRLRPGETVVVRGAHQLQMALTNKSGQGVDPHAGHTH